MPLVFSVLLMHAGANMLNDYYDWKSGADSLSSYGCSRALVEAQLSSGQFLAAGRLLLLGGVLCGVPLAFARGPLLWAVGIAGLSAGYFYTAPPLAFKYCGWGDLIIFLAFGPLPACGTALALSGKIAPETLLLSLLCGFFAVCVVSANNLRDMDEDRAAGAETLAVKMGAVFTAWEYAILLNLAYFFVPLLIRQGVYPAASGWMVLTYPLALANQGSVRKFLATGDRKIISGLDQRTAWLYALFSGFLILPGLSKILV